MWDGPQRPESETDRQHRSTVSFANATVYRGAARYPESVTFARNERFLDFARNDKGLVGRDRRARRGRPSGPSLPISDVEAKENYVAVTYDILFSFHAELTRFTGFR
jgi:hypothetical protein